MHRTHRGQKIEHVDEQKHGKKTNINKSKDINKTYDITHYEVKVAGCELELL